MTDFSRCLICQKDSSEILNNLAKRGLPRFQEAMLEHNDEVNERLRHDITDDDQFLLKKKQCAIADARARTHTRYIQISRSSAKN